MLIKKNQHVADSTITQMPFDNNYGDSCITWNFKGMCGMWRRIRGAR
jgi:hypothetical protein